MTGWDKGEQDNNPQLIRFPGPLGSPPDNQLLQLRLPPGKGGTGINRMLKHGYDKLYLRWYQLYESGFDFRAGYHGQGLQARLIKGKAGYRPTGKDWFSVKLDHAINPINGLPSPNLYSYYAGMQMDCRRADGQCWGDHLPCFIDKQRYCREPAYWPNSALPTLVTNQWYCVELMVDLGTPTPTAKGANGAMDLKFDGVSLGPWQGLWLRSSAQLQLDRLVLSYYHHGQHSVAGILIDNLVLSEQPIGCSL